MNMIGDPVLGALDDAIYSVLRSIGSAYDTVYVFSQRMFFYLAILEVLLFAINMMFGKSQNIGEIIMKFITISVLSYVFLNLRELSFIFARSICKLSEFVTTPFSNSTISIDTDTVYSPSGIFRSGNNIIKSIEDAFMAQKEEYGIETGSMSVLKLNMTGIQNWIFFLLIKVVFWIVFGILIVQLALSQIEFHITLFYSIILFPFIIFGPTKFIGEKVLPAIVGQAIRMGIVIFVTALSISVLSTNLGVPNNGILTFPMLGNMVLIACIVAFLAMQAPALASTLLSGIPNLSAGSFAQNMLGLTSAVKTGASAVSKLNEKTGATDKLSKLGNMAYQNSRNPPPPKASQNNFSRVENPSSNGPAPGGDVSGKVNSNPTPLKDGDASSGFKRS